jgi:hypothetical protein
LGANQSFASGNSHNEIAGSTTKNQIAQQKSKTPFQKAGGKFHFVKPFPPNVKKTANSSEHACKHNIKCLYSPTNKANRRDLISVDNKGKSGWKDDHFLKIPYK